MQIVIGILGVFQVLAGIAVVGYSKSAIHEILTAILFGSGSICLGLAFIISKLAGMTSARSVGAPASAPRKSSLSSDDTQTLIKIHNGRQIVRGSNGAVMVDGREFSGLSMAERYIDNHGL